jgi:hypothetical protein
MNIPAQDKSGYLKGLLILAKKDNVLAESEERIIKHIATRLGFSTDFYEYTLENLFSNEYLSEEPIKFSDDKLARSFILDGLKLARSDDKLDEREIDWLKLTALKNNVDLKWFEEKLNEIENLPTHLHQTDFALYSLI